MGLRRDAALGPAEAAERLAARQQPDSRASSATAPNAEPDERAGRAAVRLEPLATTCSCLLSSAAGTDGRHSTSTDGRTLLGLAVGVSAAVRIVRGATGVPARYRGAIPSRVTDQRSRPSATYLDAATAAPLHPVARQALLAALDDGWADPGRLYAQARRARQLLDAARAAVAEVSGGTRRTRCPSPPAAPPAAHAAVLGGLAGRAPGRAHAGALGDRALRGAARRRAARRRRRARSVPWTGSAGSTWTPGAAAVARARRGAGRADQREPRGRHGAAGARPPRRPAREAGVPLYVDAAQSVGPGAGAGRAGRC